MPPARQGNRKRQVGPCVWGDIHSRCRRDTMARVSECQCSFSIGSFGSLLGLYCLLLVVRYLLFFLLGIHEFVAVRASGIEPLQERFGFSIWLFRQDNDGVSGWL